MKSYSRMNKVIDESIEHKAMYLYLYLNLREMTLRRSSWVMKGEEYIEK
ncbi:hypothetical protein BVRB_9g211610 [Beta vulgaris subsp. vulgaris]|nr:hypothetical protein BVRB_9g211610 [Beta vulgaris subsp. vulgaris]